MFQVGTISDDLLQEHAQYAVSRSMGGPEQGHARICEAQRAKCSADQFVHHADSGSLSSAPDRVEAGLQRTNSPCWEDPIFQNDFITILQVASSLNLLKYDV